jgi:hypothetical protein
MKLSASILAVVLLAAGAAHAACSYPRPPDKLPDGSTASKEEMVAGQRAVKKYDTDINAYIACLKLEHEQQLAQQDAPITEEQKKYMERLQVQKHNAAIDELEAVAARFNEQVRAFNTKNEKKK